MGLYAVMRFVAVLVIVTSTTQLMPPSPFPYPFQIGQQMPMMHMLNGSPMMQPPNGGPMMQMPNSGPMQMTNPSPMLPHMPRLPGMASPQMPMSMPMQFPMNGGRLPMVVMPQRSKKPDKPRRRRRKPRRRRVYDGSSSSEESCSKSAEYRRSRKKFRPSSRSARRQVLTPVVSYVTKDGYVVYQKKIKKDRARDWLDMTRGDDDHDSQANEKEFKDKIRIND